MLFCQPKRTFSCSRVLLSPRSPHRTMVKNVVKTRTSKMQMWSSKNRSKHQVCGSSRKKKSNREETQCGQPESSRTKYVVNKNPNRVVKPCGWKPLRAGKRTPNSRAFFFRRCRIVTLARQIVKYKIHFVCYSSVGHDELNAIYRKRYASPKILIFAPNYFGSNKQRKRREQLREFTQMPWRSPFFMI